MKFCSEFCNVGFSKINQFLADRVVYFFGEWWAIVKENSVKLVAFAVLGQVRHAHLVEFFHGVFGRMPRAVQHPKAIDEKSTVYKDGCWHGVPLRIEKALGFAICEMICKGVAKGAMSSNVKQIQVTVKVKMKINGFLVAKNNGKSSPV